MKKIILFMSLFVNLSAAHLTEGDCCILAEKIHFDGHDYIYFSRQCVVHDPDCWCQIPLPTEECPFHSYLD